MHDRSGTSNLHDNGNLDCYRQHHGWKFRIDKQHQPVYSAWHQHDNHAGDGDPRHPNAWDRYTRNAVIPDRNQCSEWHYYHNKPERNSERHHDRFTEQQRNDHTRHHLERNDDSRHWNDSDKYHRHHGLNYDDHSAVVRQL